jgi:hypothetical protein
VVLNKVDLPPLSRTSQQQIGDVIGLDASMRF